MKLYLSTSKDIARNYIRYRYSSELTRNCTNVIDIQEEKMEEIRESERERSNQMLAALSNYRRIMLGIKLNREKIDLIKRFINMFIFALESNETMNFFL